jgi:ABC-type nitrate/sulfonate/bicarbonate transport system substrate-binding protein
MRFPTKKSKVLAVGAVLIALSLLAGSIIVLDQRKGQSEPLQNITIAVPTLEQNALIYLAESQGLFTENQLNVTVNYYASGALAFNAALAGQANLSVCAEFPFVAAAFSKQPVSIIASMDKFENEAIIVRTDHGISAPADLKGKTIGVVKQTTAEFYLGRFLDLHGMSIKDVTLVGITPAQSYDAIANGSVDALIIWQPYVDQIQKSVNNIEVWPAQSSQACYAVVSARDDWLSHNASAADRFLRSLTQAESYLVKNPEKAESIVRDKMNYTDAYMAVVWPKNNFHVDLDQSMVTAMKDEAQWMMTNNLTAAGQMPDLTDRIYVDSLRRVDPASVSIVK